jgi:hypothetical protein
LVLLLLLLLLMSPTHRKALRHHAPRALVVLVHL